MLDTRKMNPHLPFRDTGVCSICGKPRAYRNHAQCSKQRQQQHAAANSKRGVAG